MSGRRVGSSGAEVSLPRRRKADDVWQKLMTFGKHPSVSLANAREHRNSARKKLVSAIDPMAEHKARKTATTETFEHTFEKVAMR